MRCFLPLSPWDPGQGSGSNPADRRALGILGLRTLGPRGRGGFLVTQAAGAPGPSSGGTRRRQQLAAAWLRGLAGWRGRSRAWQVPSLLRHPAEGHFRLDHDPTRVRAPAAGLRTLQPQEPSCPGERGARGREAPRQQNLASQTFPLLSASPRSFLRLARPSVRKGDVSGVSPFWYGLRNPDSRGGHAVCSLRADGVVWQTAF